MRVIELPTRDVTIYGSAGVTMDFLPAIAKSSRTTVNIARITAGGSLGEHAATSLQFFVVLSGTGVVTSRGTPDGRLADGNIDDVIDRWQIEPGQVAIWESGEVHATSAITDMLVAIVEATDGEPTYRDHSVVFGAALRHE